MTRIRCLAVLAVLVVGCGGADPCAGAPCPNDARQSASEYQKCVSDHQKNSGSTCYRESVNYELCINGSRVCDGNGRTDGIASFKRANSECALAQKAVLCCSSSLFCN
jgi:hypothetical protein